MRNAYAPIRCFLFMVFVGPLVPVMARADVIHVPADYPTIQAGINAADDGDTVLVASGTYTGVGNRDITFGGRNLVLMSESGASATVIDCQGAGRGFSLNSGLDPSAMVDGFTVTNGSASKGGAVSVRGGSSPTVRNCILSNNSAPDFGGGVFVSDGSAPTFLNCTITGNHANRGGGIRVGDSTAASFIDCFVTANTATDGGGIIVQDDFLSSFTNCTVSGNEAAQGGGVLVSNNSAPTFLGCTIVGNRATYGGGLMTGLGAAFKMTGCTLGGNFAFTSGGGMYLSAAVVEPVTRTIVWSNCADGVGVGQGDEIYTTAAGSASFVCSDVGAGVEGLGSVLYDENTIHANPLFCQEFLCTKAPTTAGVYTLDDDSPALAAFSPCGELIGSQPQGCTGRSFDVTEGGQWDKIQDAIDHAVSDVDDSVIVDTKTWSGPRNTELDFGGRNIILMSKNGPENTIIDGGNAVRAIVFRNGESNAVVEGFTFVRGPADLPGSALLVEGESSPVIRNCIIKENDGNDSVVRVESGSPLLEFCTIEGNSQTALSGTGVVALAGGNPTLASCVIRNNSAPNTVHVTAAAVISGSEITDNDGCGICFESNAPSIVENSDISRNGNRGVVLDNAAADFAGVRFQENGAGGVVVTGLVPGRTARQASGAHAAAAGTNTFTDCEFSGHSTDRGGGFLFDCTNEPDLPYTVTFNNCQFTGNHATFEGGAIAICGRATNANITPIFNNCTVAVNSAKDGGGIYMGVTEVGVGREARAVFDESILWGNCSTAGPDGEAFVRTNNELTIQCSHSSIEEMTGGGTIDATDVTTGIPAFCDYPGQYYATNCQPTVTIGGDFALSPFSPASPERHPCGPNRIGAFEVRDCVPTGFGDRRPGALPTALLPPAPNPFNPSTTVEFTLETASHVMLRVYDVSGRLTRTLVDRPLAHGVHQTHWDGRDERGNPAASGVYFVRLEAGRVTQTQKMVLLK